MNEKKSLAIFVVSAITIFCLFVASAAYRQGWFESSDLLTVKYKSADGIFVGTPVLLKGLRVGSVKSVDLNADGEVVVKISVLSKYIQQLHKDARAVVGRTFVIGEKVVSLHPGSLRAEAFDRTRAIEGEEELEIVDLLSGGRISTYFDTFNRLMKLMEVVIEGDGDTLNALELYRQTHRTLKHLEQLAQDVRVIRKDVLVTDETRLLLTNLSKSSAHLQGIASDLEKTLPHVSQASSKLNEVFPDFAQTLKETTFTLQAMQKSFLLRGGVSELKEEKSKRRPASEDAAP